MKRGLTADLITTCLRPRTSDGSAPERVGDGVGYDFLTGHEVGSVSPLFCIFPVSLIPSCLGGETKHITY